MQQEEEQHLYETLRLTGEFLQNAKEQFSARYLGPIENGRDAGNQVAVCRISGSAGNLYASGAGGCDVSEGKTVSGAGRSVCQSG